MPNPSSSKPYQVLVYTKQVLVLQTNAGCQLGSDNKPDSDNQRSADNQLASKDKVAQGADSFGQFNLGLHVHDDPLQVLANRGRLLALINQYLASNQLVENNPQSPAVETIYWLNQIHSNQVIRVGEGDESNYSPLSMTPPEADALVTSKSKQALSIMTADCVPIVIFDPSTKQIAAIHAGWKGLANGIIFETVKALNTAGESEAVAIQAWIGACISQSCYEVSKDVVDKLLAGCEKVAMDSKAIKQQVVAEHQDPNKAWLDLPKLAQLQLNQLGIKVETPVELEHAGPALACSYSDSRYYSYRRKTHLGEKHTGRMALLIVKLN